MPDMLIKMKICVFGFALLLNAGFLCADVKFSLSASAGLLISSSQTDNGVIEKRMHVGGTSYRTKQEGFSSYSGIFSLHCGIVGLGGLVSLETGADFCLGNKIETVINFIDYPEPNAMFQYYYSYSSLDIPILAAFPLPLTDRLLITPAVGFYVSIPVGKAEYHQKAIAFNNPTLTESYKITTTAVAGFEGSVKLIYIFERIRNHLFLDCSFKYDLNPVHLTSNNYEYWSFARQILSVSAGYEYVF
jgi:hypothetical protein